MSCLIARADEMFDELLFASVIPRAMASRRSILPMLATSLFDLSVKPVLARRLEPRTMRREDDAERWDGLS